MQDLMKSFFEVRSTPGNFSNTFLQIELFVTFARFTPFIKSVTASLSSSSCVCGCVCARMRVCAHACVCAVRTVGADISSSSSSFP